MLNTYLRLTHKNQIRSHLKQEGRGEGTDSEEPFPTALNEVRYGAGDNVEEEPTALKARGLQLLISPTFDRAIGDKSLSDGSSYG